MLRTTVSRPVCPGVRPQSGSVTNFSFSLRFSLDGCGVYYYYYFTAPSLTRGRVCNLLFLLGFASVVPLGSESRGTQDHILLSQFLRLPKPGGQGRRIYIPQEQGGQIITPGTGFLITVTPCAAIVHSRPSYWALPGTASITRSRRSPLFVP
jgi:hypothetical protein